MAPRGKISILKQCNNHAGKKQETNNIKARKTYSIFQGNRRNEVVKEDKKRKFTPRRPNLDVEIQSKRQKIRYVPRNEVSMSESENELETHLKELCAAFGATNKISVIESSDESEFDDDDDTTAASDEHEHEDFSNSQSSDEPLNDEQDEEIDEIEEEPPADEGDQETAVDSLEEDEANTTDSRDPFVRHLFYEINESLQNSLQQIPIALNTYTETWPCLGKLVVQIPRCEASKPLEVTENSIAERKIFAPPGKVSERQYVHESNLGEMNVKLQIINNLVRANKCLTENERRQMIPLTPLQSEMFSVINNYQDFYYSERTFDNCDEIRFVYCLHMVNHILKTRTKVLHHNARLSKKDDVPEDFRDQGLTRPKILVIVPFRDSAYKIIQMLTDILFVEDKGNVINKNRFVDDFTGNELSMPKRNLKPVNYEQTFCGNTNDDFKIGITITKKSLKLYADFYSSDIIVASSLGLRYTIGAEGESDRDYDFLASIELLVFDQTEIFTMQNWDHVLHVLNHMHLQPRESHGTDFSRVRTWSLNGWAKYYRQTLIFSSGALPEIISIFNKKCYNYAGRVKVTNPIQFGSIREVYVRLPHLFHKFTATSIEDAIEARFNFFVGNIFPQQKDAMMRQTLIYVSSYFDYVRLRNYFKREDIGFVQICEYSKDAKVARARDMFFHGDAHFLLYTERHHFFNRIRIKGIRHIVFYQLPNFPHFYNEVCNLMQEANMNKKIGSASNMSVTVLYSKYDAHQLEAIVSTHRAGKMLQSDRNVHMLLTDGN